MSANLIFIYVASGIGSCLGLILLLYNVVAAILFMREQTDGTSSGLAKATWALGLLALLFAGAPCLNMLLPIAAIVLARIERGRIYRDESSLAGATPVRMGNVNGWCAFFLGLLLYMGLIGAFMPGFGTPEGG